MKYLCYLSFVLLFSHCSYPTYFTNISNVPLLSKKGEGQIQIFPGSTHLELQGSYAFLDHSAAQVNCYKRRNGYYLEGGVGAFNFNKKGLAVEIFGGYGAGHINFHDSICTFMLTTGGADRYDMNTSYNQFFLQPAIGYRESKFEVALSCRFNMIHYPVYNYSFKEYAYIYSYYYPYYENFVRGTDLTYFIITPGLTIKTGGKHVKAYMMANLFTPLNYFHQKANAHNLDAGPLPQYSPSLILGTGLTLSLNNIFFSKEK